MTVFEALTDVLLSWVPIYYELKFVLLCWLIFFSGADILYRNVHLVFSFCHRMLVKLGLLEEEEEEEWDEEDCPIPSLTTSGTRGVRCRVSPNSRVSNISPTNSGFGELLNCCIFGSAPSRGGWM